MVTAQVDQSGGIRRTPNAGATLPTRPPTWRSLWSALCFGLSFGLALSGMAAPVQPATSRGPAVAPPATGAGASFNPMISPDGRYVVFASTAEDLLAPGTNRPALTQSSPKLQVFLRDRLKQTTTLVSVKMASHEACNSDCLPVALSTNGQYVLFESSASDLVADDTNGVTDVFVRDLIAGTTRLGSASTNGGCANGLSGQSVMTPDGRYVAFVSAASNLVPGDTNRVRDVFVRDLQNGQTLLASPGVTIGSWSSDAPQITPDGHYVAFLSSAINLVPGVSTANEVYVRDLRAGVTRAVSTNAHKFISGTTIAYNHAISDDGQYVAFEANASASAAAGILFRYHLPTGSTDRIHSNAVATLSGYRHFRSLDMTPDGRFITFVARTNTSSQVYVWDGQSGTTQLASADTNHAAPMTALCESPRIDATGQFVAFLSTATNLSTNVVTGAFHLYVRDLQAGSTRLVDVGRNGSSIAKDLLNAPQLTPGGRYVAFDATDADLVADDSNAAYDVFVRDLAADNSELISARDTNWLSQTAAAANPGAGFSLSGEGRHLAFASAACNLVPNYTNAYRGVFVRDLLNGTNQLVSVDTNGLAGANGLSTDPVLSGDGRFVAFTSRADNLVAGDANQTADVFLRDLQSGVTHLVSSNMIRSGPGNGASSQPRISAEGNVVLFRSRASNLAPGSFVTTYDNLFWRDMTSGTTRAIIFTGVSCEAMTPDGRFVAYSGVGGNMYVWDAQTGAGVYYKTMPALSAIAISPDGDRVVGLKDSQLYALDRAAGTNWVLVPSTAPAVAHANLQFSADGQLVVYTTAAAQTPADTNGVADVYVYDFATQSHVLVSQSDAAAGAANGPSDSPALSASGRFVAYRSVASNLVSGDSNAVPDVFLYDRQSGTTTLLSASALGTGTGNHRSFAPRFSPDGQTLVFQSWASDLVAQDFNQGGDLFVLRLAVSDSTPVFKGEIVYAPASGRPATLTWPAAWGKTYRVQFKDSLTDLTWQELNCKVSVVGNTGYATDLAPSPSQRFYRIVAF